MDRLQNTIPSVERDTASQDERAAMLALSILDHRMAVRDQYVGAERDAFIARAVEDARLALDGASIETLATR